LVVGQNSAGDGGDVGKVLLGQELGEAAQVDLAHGDGARGEVEDFELLAVAFEEDFDLAGVHVL